MLWAWSVCHGSQRDLLWKLTGKRNMPGSAGNWLSYHAGLFLKESLNWILREVDPSQERGLSWPSVFCHHWWWDTLDPPSFLKEKSDYQTPSGFKGEVTDKIKTKRNQLEATSAEPPRKGPKNQHSVCCWEHPFLHHTPQLKPRQTKPGPLNGSALNSSCSTERQRNVTLLFKKGKGQVDFALRKAGGSQNLSYPCSQPRLCQLSLSRDPGLKCPPVWLEESVDSLCGSRSTSLKDLNRVIATQILIYATTVLLAWHLRMQTFQSLLEAWHHKRDYRN